LQKSVLDLRKISPVRHLGLTFKPFLPEERVEVVSLFTEWALIMKDEVVIT
jgi:hypothetical protein